ncbi:TPA: TerB family tellurite resistance protein [Vibrio parahaemolyticus]|nr:TerB family tellurite resistance protein [Vibrio parahaemolyticus]
MFIQNLEPKQQSALLYLAKEVMDADDELHECEDQVLSLLMSQVDASVTPEAISLEGLSALFDTNSSKASLLLELIGVAHADGDYHHNENALIKKIRSILRCHRRKTTKTRELGI